MVESLQVQIEQLHNAINGLEAQRGMLGDVIVNSAVAALREKLTLLEEQAVKQSVPAEGSRSGAPQSPAAGN